MAHMRGRGGGPIRGSGSRSVPNNHENDPIIEDDEYNDECMVNEGKGLSTLDPASIWFHTNKVKKAVREAITGKFDEVAPSWKAATKEQQEAWWNHFKFQFKRRFEDAIHAGF